ncbi:alpha/beta fold hydrolase [Aeromicrobium sp. SMF47]|uniref:Alpha/beta fold hydrolase n=1 Tax=Aeromicrobium yanjiei TaxID=2662028 RepID=A0A5Q2ML59_9ACTN|nr:MULTISPECIES: alpha/beta fold hydrolase [Aeromicrobium]MRJ77816.1 alpha/beta fold hydrolase [Aeromicrobium yanjiei]MRK02185.1 alpha/beta fold hydrolase [Aeromicrobium sp. S22]QGG41095.1 alpha/beta fold hydrolase [Aeromicrobium yanjiei]
MTSALLPGAEPYAADGGRTGVLLSHGFTGSPASMTPWAQDLVERGHSVRVPRLPGHGTTWQDMNTTRWEDWYAEVDTALTQLHQTCDRVVVAGLSMGGCLALRLAEQRPADVAALVLVNPAVSVKRLDVKLVPVLQRVIPSMPGIGNDIKRPGQDEVGYDRTPLKALASQLKMWKDVRAGLDRVTAPLLLFRSADDHVVDETSQAIILDGVASPVKELITLHDSFHVATLDNDAPRIFDHTAAFIDQHVGASRG